MSICPRTMHRTPEAATGAIPDRARSAPRSRLAAALLAALALGLPGAASEEPEPAAPAEPKTAPTDAENEPAPRDAVAQANNPLASFTAFNVHNYYIGELTDPDENANQAWFRYAQPFSIGPTDWLLRASLPINTFPVPDHKTGLGDFNVFAAYLFDMGDRKLSVGLGPQITLPTATEDALGSEKWSAGLMHILFNYASQKFQYGYLLTWQASYAGESDRDDVNVGAFQPFLFYQLGHGTYLRSTAVMSYNFDSDTYTVPLGLGIGQVIPFKRAVFNLFVEPQYSVADKGPGWPKWQIFIGINTQFR